MQRVDENTIQITQEELTTLEFFIDSALDKMWDHYTDLYVCTCSWEEGKRKMNSTLYDMITQMRDI